VTADFRQGIEGFLPHVETLHPEAGLRQQARAVGAHGAEADECDSRLVHFFFPVEKSQAVGALPR
jgi:hypothetical protein